MARKHKGVYSFIETTLLKQYFGSIAKNRFFFDQVLKGKENTFYLLIINFKDHFLFSFVK